MKKILTVLIIIGSGLIVLSFWGGLMVVDFGMGNAKHVAKWPVRLE